MTDQRTIDISVLQQRALQSICIEAVEAVESIYAFLEDEYPDPTRAQVNHTTLGQPISSLTPAMVLALRDLVDCVDGHAAAQLVATLCERFEAEMTDSRRVPKDPKHGQQHVLVLGLFLSVVLIPICQKSGSSDRAVALTSMFTRQMTSTGYARIPIAGGRGFGDSTLAILMLPLGALCKPVQ